MVSNRLQYAGSLLILSVLLLVGYTPLSSVSAETDTILVTTVVSDQTVPSVPTGLVARASSNSQINLTWDASTDDIGVSGYKIFRDLAYIALSPTTFYSDTGLSTSTYYSYTVSAIDAAGNESAKSAMSGATTLSGEGSGGGGGIPSDLNQLDIINLQVVPFLTSASISFETTVPTESTVRWGETFDFEGGSGSATTFSRDHAFIIPNLKEATRYYFEILVTDPHGTKEGYTGTFVTLSSDPVVSDTEPIPSLVGFSATPNQGAVDLKWEYPSDPRITEVRIVRNTEFFPEHPEDGIVVYEGPGIAARDSSVQSGVRYYYTAFPKTINAFGTGVVDDAMVPLPGGETPAVSDPFEQFPDALTTHPLIESLSILDFDFIQDGVMLPKTGNRVFIDGSKNLTVSIAYHKLPEVLKTIGVTLIHPEDPESTFSFILRVNEDKTHYVATIGALGASGMYPMGIRVLDYENRGMKRLRGSLYVAEAASTETFELPRYFLGSIALQNILLIILNILFILMFFKRRKREKE